MRTIKTLQIGSIKAIIAYCHNLAEYKVTLKKDNDVLGVYFTDDKNDAITTAEAMLTNY